MNTMIKEEITGHDFWFDLHNHASKGNILMFPPNMAVLVALVAMVTSRSSFILLHAGIRISLTISSIFLWSLAIAATFQLGLQAKIRA